jgi:hypothetical protein
VVEVEVVEMMMTARPMSSVVQTVGTLARPQTTVTAPGVVVLPAVNATDDK